MFGERKRLTSIVGVLWLAMSLIGAAQSGAPNGDTYQWSGELVAVDATTSTLTVKSRIAYQEAASEVKQFKPGEKVWIVWSGIHDYSDAVRQVRRASTGNKIAEDLVMPAELVTVTSRHRPSTEAEAIVAIKPYGSTTN